jgi:hypothetical protein
MAHFVFQVQGEQLFLKVWVKQFIFRVSSNNVMRGDPFQTQ